MGKRMWSPKRVLVSIWGLLFLGALFTVPVGAQHTVELTPSISVREVYDDNINLDATNEESDFITTVSPRIEMHVRTLKTDFGLAYSPGFVWYGDNDENNTVRHTGVLTLNRDLSERWRCMVSNTYVRSEDPIEETEGVTGVRRTRNTYQRNTGDIGFAYRFGADDSLNFGYRHSWLENDDVTLDDSISQNPYASLTYWVNIKSGFEVTYGYDRVDFSRDDGAPPDDDYRGHNPGIRYLHRLSPHSVLSVGYNFSNRIFDGTTSDYRVHEGSLGFDHRFSPELALSAGVGYFTQNSDGSGDQSGVTYNASLEKHFERATLSVGGNGGWDEAYEDAEMRGFTRFWSINSRLSYQMAEALTCYIGGSFRMDEDASDREWETRRGSVGLSWDFHRWLALALDYTLADRDDDVDTDDYTVNRVMLTLRGSRLFRW